MRTLYIYVIIAAMLIPGITASADEEVKKRAVMIAAEVDSSDSPSITLSWPQDTAVSYTVSRKEVNGSDFDHFVGVADSGATSLTDKDVRRGVHYEYKIIKAYRDFDGWGYVSAGFDVALPDHKGRILVLVDYTVREQIPDAINRYQRGLTADGWQAKVVSVPRSEQFNPRAVINIRQIIRAEHERDSLRAVVLLGRVPVAYSGDYAIDGHSEHIGAWPADPFYAELDGIWTDSSAEVLATSRYQNINSIGDGKYDQIFIPTKLELEIGRIDFFDLPDYPQSEIKLIENYLDKNQKFRYGEIRPRRMGIITDNFGMYSNEAFAADGWINLSALVGYENISEASMRYEMRDKSFMWAYGCGSGTYYACHEVAYPETYVGVDQHCAFVMLFGSRFGDWDSRNNIMRIIAASAPMVQNVVWAARPFWHFHQMGMGETIGYCGKVSMNNVRTYESSGQYGYHQSHMALLGDPTMKMYVAPPPGEVSAELTEPGDAELSWAHADGEIFGYNLYRAANYEDKFERINANIIHENSYVDRAPLTGRNIYLVRSVKREESQTGSFFHQSAGRFAEIISETDTVAASGLEIEVYPNPASESVSIEISLESENHLTINIYDQNGRRVASPVDGVYPAGDHIFPWDLRDDSGERVVPGVYIASAAAGVYVATIELIILP